MWKDPWVPWLANKAPFFRKPEVLTSLFFEEEISEIEKFKCPQMESEDKVCWTTTKDGSFLVRSCYGLFDSEERE